MYNSLREKLGEEQAQKLTLFVEQQVERSFEKEKEHLATKGDILATKALISETKAEILKWIFLMFAPFYVGMIVF